MIKILLVEDELLVRSGMKSLIKWEDHGFQLVAEAAHGEEALEILQRERIDIVITDIRMPVMDGLSLIENIKKLELPCEVIVLSSYDEFDYVRKAMQYGVKDYFHKPTMTQEELIKVLQNVAAQIFEKKNKNTYEKIIMDTLEESRDILIEKVVRQALINQPQDQKIMSMLKEKKLLQLPFNITLIKMLSKVQQNLDLSMQKYTEEQIIQSNIGVILEQEKDNLYFLEEGIWVFFTLSSAQLVGESMQEDVKEKYGIDIISVNSEASCSFEEVGAVYSLLKKNIQGLIQEWEKNYALHPLIQESLTYIKDHFMDNLTLDKMSSIVHVSPTYFSRLFCKEVGSTFIDFLSHYRIQKAKEYLLQTDLRTYEIADKIGYKNTKYFIKVFKRITGLTPGEHRNQAQSD